MTLTQEGVTAPTTSVRKSPSLVCVGSVEDRIHQRQRKKALLSRAVKSAPMPSHGEIWLPNTKGPV